MSLPVKVIFNDQILYGDTIDVSETGLAVKMNQSVLIPKGTVRIHVKTHHYNAHFNAKEVYVTDYIDSVTGEKMYRYSFAITELDEENKSQYYQLIYDREPSLPSFTAKEDSVFANLSDNFEGRIEGVHTQKRRLYRVYVHEEVKEADGSKGFMYDYNYRYVALNWNDQIGKKTREILFGKGINMTCSFVRCIDDNRAL